MRSSLIIAVSLAVGSLVAPAAAEVVATTEDGFVTRDTEQVAATPLETWLALTKPADWWNDSHTWSGDAANMTLTPQAGGCFCETIPGDDGSGGFAMDGSAQHAVIVQAYPLQSLRMRGGLGPLQGEPATGILTITLKEIEGGTRILWEYNVGGPMRYDIDEISTAVDGVMSQQLMELRDHLGALEGGDEVEPDQDTDTEDDNREPATDAPRIESEATLEAQIDALADDE